ncbi:uncharacterized protein TNCV_1562821 [Trichonephila clavipes]|nr:uncharacterized protein TNCV_1562821 [Trichonephila clavipes]
MEVAGALSKRSQSLYNVRYTKYLGDGDIVENKVYGDHCSVEKLECIGHVMKRMGTRLRRLKTKMRGQKLSDGKPLCGRNRLTEAEIDRLQAYYDTWCKFKKAEFWETYHHKNSLPVDVVEAMRPVFRDLANPELLKSVYMEVDSPSIFHRLISANQTLDKHNIKKKRNGHVQSLLDEVETDQASEIIDINHDNESKIDEHFQLQPKEFHQENMKPQVYHKTHCILPKRHKQERVEHVYLSFIKGQQIHNNLNKV